MDKPTLADLSEKIPSVYAVEDDNGSIVKISEIISITPTPALYLDYYGSHKCCVAPDMFRLFINIRGGKCAELEYEDQKQAQNYYECIKIILQNGLI